MIRFKSLRRPRFVFGAGAIVLAAAAVTVFVLPGTAEGRGRSQVIAFGAADIPSVFKDGLAASARHAGVDGATLKEVAPAGQPVVTAGVVVGHAAGGDMVAFFTAHSFTNFRSVAVASNREPLTIGASIQPDAAGNTGHVQLLGIVAPEITRVTVDLKDGSTVDVQLVRAGSGGYSFFTYTSDDPLTFPTVAHAYSAAGIEQQQRDLTLALAPPR